jgi:hypothetical protein
MRQQIINNTLTNLMALFLGFILGALIGGAPVTIWTN